MSDAPVAMGKCSGPPAGYTHCEDDGLYRRAVTFGAGQREVLVRDRRGRLVRVERGDLGRRFLLCAP